MKTVKDTLHRQSLVPEYGDRPFEELMRYCIQEKIPIHHKKCSFGDVLMRYPQRLTTPNEPKSGLHAVMTQSTGYRLLVNHKNHHSDFEAQKKHLSYPKIMQSLMWQYIFDEFAGTDNSEFFIPLLNDLKVPWSRWMKYQQEFENHHDWLKMTPIAVKT